MVTPEALRIVYFGTPEFAVPTLGARGGGGPPGGGGGGQPDRPRGRGQKLQPSPTKQLAASRGVPVLQPLKLREDAFLGAIRDLAPDLGVVAAYGRILPDALLQIPRLGMINVHASLLPEYRGAAPVHRAVIAGERETGVSIMRVVTELDAGPVFATARTTVGADATSVEVEAALADMGAALLVDVVDHIAAGRAVEVPQDHARATHAAKITKEEARVDWSQPAAAVHNLIRGLQPWPLASIWIAGARYQLHRSTLPGERTGAAPGTIVHAARGRLAIGAGDGGVVDVLAIQPEGRRVMTSDEFLRGHRVEAGTRVTPP
jgi:methionyl-tRNA formyltransferase